MSDDESDHESVIGRPRGSADTYQRQRESTSERRYERLLELGDFLLDTGRHEEERNAMVRVVLALMLGGWNRETYLSDPTRTDIIAKLLEPLPPSKGRPKSSPGPRGMKRSLTGYKGL